MDVETEFMPLCMLGTRYDRVDNFYTTRVNLSDLHWFDADYSRPPGDIFYEVCDSCDVRNQCLGVDSLASRGIRRKRLFQSCFFRGSGAVRGWMMFYYGLESDRFTQLLTPVRLWILRASF